jgi:GUN4-like
MFTDHHQPTQSDVVLGNRERQAQIPTNGVVLGSNFEASERNLRNLLEQQRWQDADLATTAMMLEMGGHKEDSFLTLEDLRHLEHDRLQTIDRLWTTNSQNQFGFSVQVEIWQGIGGIEFADWDAWFRFGAMTGWYNGYRWIGWDRVQFSLDARRGHLPRGGVFMGWELHDFWMRSGALSAALATMREKLGKRG